jgi:hypothetical protein
MKVFESLREALRQGYYVQDRIINGYLVVTRTSHGFARALVILK